MNKHFGYIYKITCTNSKSHLYLSTYYGQHKTSKEFDKNYICSSSRLKNEYFPYYNEYNYEILEYCNSKEELNDREIYWIKFGRENDINCINVQSGGSSNFITTLSQKQAAEKRWKDPEEHIKASMRAKEYYKEHPNEMSRRRIGKNQFHNETQEQTILRKERVSKGQRNFWENQTDEYKYKRRENSIKASHTPEANQKRVNSILKTWEQKGTSFKGKNNPSFGHKWMHNKIDDQVYPKAEDIQSYLDKGYIFGKLKYYLKINSNS